MLGTKVPDALGLKPVDPYFRSYLLLAPTVTFTVADVNVTLDNPVIATGLTTQFVSSIAEKSSKYK